MANRQPISLFALQASNSARKLQGGVTQRRSEQPPQSTRMARGTLRFRQPSGASRPTASSPIWIDDDPAPMQETASSWEKDEYQFTEYADHDPYDETWKPPERDSEDETMATSFRKTRQQPQRIASSRKPARGVPDAIFTESHGMYTPPATNNRQGRRGTAGSATRRGSSLKGKEKASFSTYSAPLCVSNLHCGYRRKRMRRQILLTLPYQAHRVIKTSIGPRSPAESLKYTSRFRT